MEPHVCPNGDVLFLAKHQEISQLMSQPGSSIDALVQLDAEETHIMGRLKYDPGQQENLTKVYFPADEDWFGLKTIQLTFNSQAAESFLYSGPVMGGVQGDLHLSEYCG